MGIAQQDWLSAQHSVLGAALIEPRLIPDILSRVDEQDFSGRSLPVFQAIRYLCAAGVPIDVVSVRDRLGSEYSSYLAQLMEITPTAAHYRHYCELCRKQSKLCRLRDIGEAMAATESAEEMQQLLSRAAEIASETKSAQIVSVREAMLAFVQAHSDGVKRHFLTWPIPALDKLLFIESGDFVVLGGRPSAGKTALALQIAWHLSTSYSVGFFSLETSTGKITDRQVAAAAGVPFENIKQNALNQAQWDSIIALDAACAGRKLDYISQANLSVSDLQSISLARGYDIVFIDYLQLLAAPGKNRYEAVTEISMSLHRFAQSRGVCVFALSQLSRELHQHGKKAAPDMSSLRESGQLEQDADAVLLLYLENEQDPASPRVLRCAKNKEGERFSSRLEFDGAHQIFRKAPPARSDYDREMARLSRERKESEKLARQNQLTILPADTPVPGEFITTKEP